MANIPSEELRKLLANIRLAFGQPNNKAAWALGRASLTTLEDYLAAEAPASDQREEDGDDLKTKVQASQ